MTGGDFAFGKRPPSWAHISHAQDGFAVGKGFCYPVGADVKRKIFTNIRCVASGKNSCFCTVRATSVLAFLYQNANAKSEYA